MDYVVFGIGFGATILVLGLLLRDLGPRLRYRRQANDDGVLPADVLVAKVAWDRFCNALGAVLAIGGILFLLITFVCIILAVSDDTGGWVMLSALAVFFLMVLYWTWAFFHRFGAYGILLERSAAEEEPEPEPAQRPEPMAGSEAGPVAVAPAADDAVEPQERVIVGPVLDQVASRPEAEHEEVADEEAKIADSEPEAAEPENGEQTVVLTPEERLARHEEPLDHGSAAGDLDETPGVARPSAARGRGTTDREITEDSAEPLEDETSEDEEQVDAADFDEDSEQDQEQGSDAR
ncbi:MAG TPA: hypothetical protein VGR22_00020 [Thermomicrobiales bacterium]|nr:hypothetical protein [Thermomicrobiales bacterium]